MFFRIVAVAGVFVASALPAHAEPDYHAANVQIVDGHLMPAYENLSDKGQALGAVLADYCADGGADMSDVGNAYHNAMGAWQHAQHIRFGPIIEQNRNFRLQYWPDKRNRTAKSVAQMVQRVGRGDELNFVLLRQMSIAAQGFPALGRLVFSDDHALEPKTSRCTVAAVIGENIATISKNVYARWTDGYADQIRTADIGTDAYAVPKDAAFELFKVLKTALQWVEDTKLRRVAQENAAEARGRRAEAWRTGRSLQHIAANFEAVKGLYTAGGRGGFSALMRQKDGGKAVDTVFLKLLADAKATVDAIDTPLMEAVTDQGDRPKVDHLIEDLRAMRRLIDEDMARLLDMPLGFNSLDGD